MANTFRHVWQFKQVDGSTFEEIFYHSGGAIGGESPPVALIDARRDLLMDCHTLQRIRIAGIDGNRLTAQKPIFLPGLTPVAGFAPAPPGASMVCLLAGDNGGSRHWWMRGGAAIDFQNSPVGRPAPTGGWFKKFAAWIVQANGYGYGLVQRENRTVNPYVVVTAVAPAVGSTGQTTLTLDSLHNEMAKDTQVIVGRFSKKDFPALNGIFTVRKNAVGSGGTTVLTIDYVLPGNTAPMVPITGKVRVYTARAVSVFGILGSNLAYLGTRITKGPTSNSRGARRAARIRQVV